MACHQRALQPGDWVPLIDCGEAGGNASFCRDLLTSPSGVALWVRSGARKVNVVIATGKIKTEPRGPVSVSTILESYLIFDSLNSTCLRATGSYFFLTSLSVMVREFFLAT